MSGSVFHIGEILDLFGLFPILIYVALTGFCSAVVALFLVPELEKIRTPFRYFVPLVIAVLIALFMPVFSSFFKDPAGAVSDAQGFFLILIIMMGAIMPFWVFDTWISVRNRGLCIATGVFITVACVYFFSNTILFPGPVSAFPRWALPGFLVTGDGFTDTWIYYSVDSLFFFIKGVLIAVPVYAVFLLYQTAKVYWNNYQSSR